MGNCICQNNDNDNDNDNLKKATLDVEKFTLEGTSMYGKNHRLPIERKAEA